MQMQETSYKVLTSVAAKTTKGKNANGSVFGGTFTNLKVLLSARHDKVAFADEFTEAMSTIESRTWMLPVDVYIRTEPSGLYLIYVRHNVWNSGRSCCQDMNPR